MTADLNFWNSGYSLWRSFWDIRSHLKFSKTNWKHWCWKEGLERQKKKNGKCSFRRHSIKNKKDILTLFDKYPNSLKISKVTQTHHSLIVDQTKIFRKFCLFGTRYLLLNDTLDFEDSLLCILKSNCICMMSMMEKLADSFSGSFGAY